MTLALTDEHQALASTARRWCQDHCPPSVPRAVLETPADELPAFWTELADLGWLGLHLPESVGGQGYGVAELAIVLEELGRVMAPGPVLASVSAALVIDRTGDDDLRHELLPALADGTRVGAVAFAGLDVVPGGAVADLVVMPHGDGWAVADVEACAVRERRSLDATRRVAAVEPGGTVRPLTGSTGAPVAEWVALLMAAESVGLASWCVDTTSAYTRDRVQFGRPIGQFQAVKHRLADMLAQLELGRAAVWDAARGGPDDEAVLAARVAAAIAVQGAASIAKDTVQLHGGIGFTWEHDAHLYLKRAIANRQLIGGATTWRTRVADAAIAGVRRRLPVELPPAEAERHRVEVRTFLTELARHPKTEWHDRIAESGYLLPHYPRPWGRDAGPVEQLVIDQEFRAARVRRRHLAVGLWALPPLVTYGTRAQQDRWMMPTMKGQIAWCQLFSEPGAGSDLAGLSTRATRVEGGWVLNGQKVWTSMAQEADWGICLARTDPELPKHDGITFFFCDMRTPGIDIRPLRELTGDAWFNEVFLTDVFVPDDCVIGAVNDGWRASRTALATERVSMGGGASIGPGLEALLARLGPDTDPHTMADVGALVAEHTALAALGTRMTFRAVHGSGGGPESSIRKLLGVIHDQRVHEVGLAMFGPAGAASDDEAQAWVHGFLWDRSLTIAGGTSEVQRNVIAERLLGQPRDP